MPEERVREGLNRRQEVSVLNWMGTMLLLMVPAVLAGVVGYLWPTNLIVLIGATLLADIVLMTVIMMTARKASKRNAMVAALILTVLFIVGSLLGCAFFGDRIATFFETLNAPAVEALDALPAPTPQAQQIPTPTPRPVEPTPTPTVPPVAVDPTPTVPPVS